MPVVCNYDGNSRCLAIRHITASVISLFVCGQKMDQLQNCNVHVTDVYIPAAARAWRHASHAVCNAGHLGATPGGDLRLRGGTMIYLMYPMVLDSQSEPTVCCGAGGINSGCVGGCLEAFMGGG